jgi:hypothetical protein
LQIFRSSTGAWQVSARLETPTSEEKQLVTYVRDGLALGIGEGGRQRRTISDEISGGRRAIGSRILLSLSEAFIVFQIFSTLPSAMASELEAEFWPKAS